MYNIEDIEPGKSYGCKFKVTAMLELYDEKSRKTFRVSFDDIWDIDDVEYVDAD